MPFIERQSGFLSVLLKHGRSCCSAGCSEKAQQDVAVQRRAEKQQEGVVRRDGEADCVKMEGEVRRGDATLATRG